jgi:hypothetical protein
MVAVDRHLINSLQTAAATIDVQQNYAFIVGQSVNAQQRALQAAAFNEIISQRDQRTYLATLYRQLLAAGVRTYSGMSGQDVARRAASEATGAMADVVQAVGQNYGRLIRSRRGAFAAANRDVGREANRAALVAYQSAKGEGSKFRSGEGSLKFRRYAGGQLAAAIGSDEMFIARPDGLTWINAAHLDQKAPQWYRLNFGAGAKGAASGNALQYQVTFLGQPVGTIGLASFRSSPSFYMPAGFFSSDGSFAGRSPFGAGRGQAYRPFSYKGGQLRSEIAGALQNASPRIRGQIARVQDLGSNRLLTQGIRAMNFLDAGMASIARTWPVRQTSLIRDILNESVRSGGTTTEFSIGGVDLADQRRFLAQTSSELDRLIVQLQGARGRSFVSNQFLSSL